MPGDRPQFERGVPVKDEIEGGRHALQPCAADPKLDVGGSRRPLSLLNHLRIHIDAQTTAEQAGQVAESLTAASADVKNLVNSTQVPRNDLGVNPWAWLAQDVHPGEVPAPLGCVLASRSSSSCCEYQSFTAGQANTVPHQPGQGHQLNMVRPEGRNVATVLAANLAQRHSPRDSEPG